MGTKIIEIENPVDKGDLVRFSDSYGTKKKKTLRR